MFEPNDNLPNKGPSQPKRPSGFAFVFFFLAIGLLFTYLFRGGDNTSVMNITYTEFMRFADQGQIESVVINSNDTIDIFIKGASSNGATQLKTKIPYEDPNLISFLKERI